MEKFERISKIGHNMILIGFGGSILLIAPIALLADSGEDALGLGFILYGVVCAGGAIGLAGFVVAAIGEFGKKFFK